MQGNIMVHTAIEILIVRRTRCPHRPEPTEQGHTIVAIPGKVLNHPCTMDDGLQTFLEVQYP
jgi:hypothetical protein